MIISLNLLKKFVDIDVSVDDLTELIGSRLVEIEEVVDLGKKYEGVVIAKVVECKPVEGSDHLNVTKIDDGGLVSDVERDDSGYVQVVCGAPNVREGLTVAWLPPGSTVPETYGKEPFVLGARQLRGVMSNGMLASAKELDLFDDHTGILELDDKAVIGTKFADAYELNDYLLDIENKSLTHRPDTFGIIGFAREIAGIQGKSFVTPQRLTSEGIVWIEKQGDEPTPQVSIDDPSISARYQAVVLTSVNSKTQSPLETQTYLARLGVRPHSAVVDATNYLMMLTGQPLHAFDYDKLKAVNNGHIDIHVRGGQAGEKLTLIDGREIELSDNDIVIANGNTPVALAGAMGGKDTEIDDETTNVLLESATFNLYNLRNTQMRHGIFSEAITRFTKGQPAELTEFVLAEAVGLLAVTAGAVRASEVADAYPEPAKHESVSVAVEDINNVLGSDFSLEQITSTLTNVGFEADASDDSRITVTPPYWRTDIHIPEDIVEEVGRLNGFDNLAPRLPKRDFAAVSPDPFDIFRSKVRDLLARAGANEILTYSFVHGDMLQKAGQNVSDAYKIVNSISPELQYYRLSLTPSLLSLVHPNSKAGYDEFALFELNKVHSKTFGLDEDKTPVEKNRLALTVARKSSGATYYEAKRIADYLAQMLKIEFSYTPLSENSDAIDAPFDPKRSAVIAEKQTGKILGVIGEYKHPVKKGFKLGDAVAGFEIDLQSLYEATATAKNAYAPLSRYPSSERDVCFQVDKEVSHASVKDAVQEIVDSTDLSIAISPLDIYQPNDGFTKNITLRIRMTSYEKTLSGEEVTEVMTRVIDHVCSKLGATVV